MTTVSSNRLYRFVYIANGGLDLVSEIEVDRVEAYEHLAVDRALHILTGWDVTDCACSRGFNAVRGDTRRSVHVIPTEELLAEGLLQPASHRNGLEVVA